MRRGAALLNSKCPRPCGRGGGSQEPTHAGDIRGLGSYAAGGDGPGPTPQPATATGTARPPLERGQALATASSQSGEGPRGNR